MVVAVLGSTGYAGMTLLRLLVRHPNVEKILAVSSSQAGASIGHFDPGLSDATLARLGHTFASVEEAAEAEPQVVFSGLPHLTSAEVLAPFYEQSIVVDLSADFRIPDAELFERAYGSAPPAADRLPSAAYGIPELYREAISKAPIIANPGCYPTAALMPVVPLARDGVIGGRVIVNALSGVSGAGRKVKQNLLFGERSENVQAYGPGTSHRHWAEIYHYLKEAELRSAPGHAAAGGHDAAAGPGDAAEAGPAASAQEASAELPDSAVLFTPHLVPIKQGIVATIVTDLAAGATEEQVTESLHTAYGDAPFVRLTREHIPETRDVRNTNRCDIAVRRYGDQLMLFAAIDNLHKGAAGQALQNMNVRLGLDEQAGLQLDGEF
jgi:N-acetyl-gamma-glutamyl-phosphate reductase